MLALFFMPNIFYDKKHKKLFNYDNCHSILYIPNNETGKTNMREQIQKLLDSDFSSLHIAKQTGVEQSTVYRLRKVNDHLINWG